MDINEILNLTRDEKQHNLYDLFIQTYKTFNDHLNFIIVSKKYEMRLDFLCSDLYGDINYIGLLMKTNNIFNPYSIKVGDLIFYVPNGELTYTLYKDQKTIQKARLKLINALRSSNVDKNRQDFLDSLRNKPLKPLGTKPTISPDGSTKNIVDGGYIKVAPNLFTTPSNVNKTNSNNGLGDIITNPNFKQPDNTLNKTFGNPASRLKYYNNIGDSKYNNDNTSISTKPIPGPGPDQGVSDGTGLTGSGSGLAGAGIGVSDLNTNLTGGGLIGSGGSGLIGSGLIGSGLIGSGLIGSDLTEGDLTDINEGLLGNEQIINNKILNSLNYNNNLLFNKYNDNLNIDNLKQVKYDPYTDKIGDNYSDNINNVIDSKFVKQSGNDDVKSGNVPNITQDQFERILVNKFIRSNK